MFLGLHEHSIDDKGRLTIPSRYREELVGGAYLTQGFEKNVIVLPVTAFKAIYESINKSSLTDPKGRELRRKLFSHAIDVEVDRTGRILLPQFLREQNELEGIVMVAGSGGYFEIWSKAAWLKQEEKANDPEANEDRYSAINMLIGVQ